MREAPGREGTVRGPRGACDHGVLRMGFTSHRHLRGRRLRTHGARNTWGPGGRPTPRGREGGLPAPQAHPSATGEKLQRPDCSGGPSPRPVLFFRVCGRLLLKSTVLPNLVANSHLQNHALRLPFRAAGLGAPRLRRAPGRAPGLPQAPALRASGPRVPWLRTRSPLARVSVTAGRAGLPVGAAWKAPQGFEAPGSPAPSCPVIGRGEDSSPGFGQ